MRINIQIDPDILTVGDLLDLEDAQEGKKPLHTIIAIVGKFLVDEKGNYLDSKAANETMRTLSMTELNQVTDLFLEKMKEIQTDAVPQAKGGD